VPAESQNKNIFENQSAFG